MGNEIFEEIKKKYEKTKNFSYARQDSFYIDKSFFEDMGKLIQIIETMNKRKLQDMILLFKKLMLKIEKQSKEIEELNKSDASKEYSSMNYYNLYKDLVDKIKAKIEDIQNMYD